MKERGKKSFVSNKETSSIIKIIGVGGIGFKVVSLMYREKIYNVTYLLCVEDKQELVKSNFFPEFKLGKKNNKQRKSGKKPPIYLVEAKDSIDDIKMMLDDGTEMVFIVSKMGNTGAEIAPLFAEVAKQMGILTVGIVNIPHASEEEDKILQAANDLEEMRKNVDSLLVVNNESLTHRNLSLSKLGSCLKVFNELKTAVKSISEIITLKGYIDLDFADVKNTLKDGGNCVICSGLGSGEDRISEAICNAINSHTFCVDNIYNAKKILFQLIFGSIESASTKELFTITDFFIENFYSDIYLIWGTASDESLKDQVKINIIASGVDLTPFHS